MKRNSKKDFGVGSVKKAFIKEWNNCSSMDTVSILTQSNQLKQVRIGFIPATPAPPTQKDVIEKIIKYTVNLS